MENWQKIILLTYLTGAVFSLVIGLKKVSKDKDNLGLSRAFYVYGAFVWADTIIFGLFWTLFSFVALFLNDWILFILGYSIFWFIRSLGESFYWFNQQFSTIKRYSYKDFPFSKFFHNDDYTNWFVMQIIMQCISVVSAILSIFFARLWIANMI